MRIWDNFRDRSKSTLQIPRQCALVNCNSRIKFASQIICFPLHHCIVRARIYREFSVNGTYIQCSQHGVACFNSFSGAPGKKSSVTTPRESLMMTLCPPPAFGRPLWPDICSGDEILTQFSLFPLVVCFSQGRNTVAGRTAWKQFWAESSIYIQTSLSES